MYVREVCLECHRPLFKNLQARMKDFDEQNEIYGWYKTHFALAAALQVESLAFNSRRRTRRAEIFLRRRACYDDKYMVRE
jgi:hypothetical protein